jgi:AcrR family transcriptional regulator
MGPSVERPQRSDARRNRARLIEITAEAFRDEGLDIGVDELARRAGVGIATLYRHFPAKTDLIVAVMDLVFEELQRAAAEALAADPPELTLATFLNATLAVQRSNRGFLEAFAQHDLPGEVRASLTPRILAILEPIVGAGHRSGTIRPELDATDLLVIVRMLGVVSAQPQRGAPDPYVETLLRGLRAG